MFLQLHGVQFPALAERALTDRKWRWAMIMAIQDMTK
jgi:hypothetical protein